jgi:hypothetical protein
LKIVCCKYVQKLILFKDLYFDQCYRIMKKTY